MKQIIALLLFVFAAGVSAQCSCNTMKWATCDGSPCQCSLLVGDSTPQVLNCSALIPKCFLMKAEMYRASKGLSTRTGGKPVETALVDNDGIYNSVCEANGRFKAKQCNDTQVCWCVNSAGVRRSDKGDQNIKCDELVETYWVRLDLKHQKTNVTLDQGSLKSAIQNVITQRYGTSQALVHNVQYDPDARLIVVDVQKTIGDRTTDLATMAYYMEKDVKVLPLFVSQAPFAPVVNGQPLSMENILVYYVDEKAPTITMQRLTGGVIAVIVVVLVAVIGGLLILFFVRRKEKAKYSKAQPREMENLS